MKVLYICTHNRCRSILCEAISNASSGKLQARSAGSQPVGEVHPLSLKYLAQKEYNVEGLESQSWDEFEDFEPDLVITVCDSAAGESCPFYFSKSLKVHWGLEDPSKLEGSEQDKAEAFYHTIELIEQRVSALTAISEKNLSQEQLKNELLSLGAS